MNDNLDPAIQDSAIGFEQMNPEAIEPEKEPNVESVIKKRLASQRVSHQKELDRRDSENSELKSRLQDLESKVSATQNGPQMIPVDAIPMIQEQYREEQNKRDRINKVSQKINEASEKDPELKQLVSEKGNMFSADDVALMGKFEAIPNIAAVIKRILKDPTEYQIYSTAPNEFEKAKFIKDLSEKIDNRNPERNRKYEPAEQLSGSSPQGEDLSEYVNKYRGKKR